MAQLTINVPDAQLERVLAAFAATYGYQEQVPGDPPAPDPDAPAPDGPVPPSSGTVAPMKPNPENRRAFTKRMLQQHVMAVVRSYEVSQASSKAQETAAKKVEDEVVLT